MRLHVPALLLALTFDAAAQTYQQRVDAAMDRIEKTVMQGPFHATWESLENYEVPRWYQDAKFGIFIHWGVYSVPAFGSEWYPRNMYLENSVVFKHHIASYGPQSQFGYKDFIPRFKAERFDPRHWAEVFRKSGARYIVPVAEHHDGFPMYDCSFTEWNAAKMGPKRDVVGELAAAVRDAGLHFGASSHRAEHWWFYDGGMKFDSDVKDPRYAALYGPAKPESTQPDDAYLKDWIARTAEIVDKYHPELIWFDWWIEQPVFQPYLQKFAAFYYNRGVEWKRGVAINYKKKSFPEHTAVLDIERGQLDTLQPLFWQTDTSISKKSWGYIQGDEFRSTDSLVDELVDIVSKNGTFLLNIGPRPDGAIPEPAEKILLEMGQWLAVNGDAIYGSRPWKIYGEGPTEVAGGSFKDAAVRPFTSQDIRFTSKGDTLYAIALAWPEDGKLIIKSLGTNSPLSPPAFKTVQLLGSKTALKWSRDGNGLHIQMPMEKPCDYAFALKINPVDRAPASAR